MIPTSATGGAGSYPPDTLKTQLFGIDRLLDGAFSYMAARETRKAAEVAEQRTLDANGDVQLAGAPEAKGIGMALANPYVLGGIALLLGAVIYLAVKD